jgi:lysophospholipase
MIIKVKVYQEDVSYPKIFFRCLLTIFVCFKGLTESQSLWVHAFDDYVDDFMYFVTTITKDLPNLPIFVLAHSMGGFIAANAMCRLPALVQRAILLAPMIRNLSGVKALDYRGSLPQTVAYWLAAMNKHLGMGTVHCLGYFKEKPTDRMNINVITSDQEQLDKWMDLRMRYPNIIATCVTNDWIYHSIRAQNKFESKYEFVKTNTLILW